jgi:Zn-dependent protease
MAGIMPGSKPFAIPFMIAPGNLAVDDVVIFVVVMLTAVLINAEAQAFAATLLGDARAGAKDRFHFNVFLHLDILGTLCFLAGGFGWPRTVKVDAAKLRRPWYIILVRFAGPVGNVLLANIAASIVWMAAKVSWDARVFAMLAAVNVTVAVYNLLPIPPLAGGSIWEVLIPPDRERFRQIWRQAGPFLVLALVLVERLTGHEIISGYLNPLARGLFTFIVG